MNEGQLADTVFSARDVLKVETLDAYDAGSDSDHLDRYIRGDPKPDPSEKAEWLDLLRARADAGHPWRWLRVVTRPVPQYVRYSAEFGYVDNVKFGGVNLRVLDEVHFPGYVQALRSLGDLYRLDGRLIAMRFESGRFLHAENVAPWRDGAGAALDLAWSRAVPFTQWWADNVDLHRTLTSR